MARDAWLIAPSLWHAGMSGTDTGGYQPPGAGADQSPDRMPSGQLENRKLPPMLPAMRALVRYLTVSYGFQP